MARKWWALFLLALILAAGGLYWTWHEATLRLEAELARWSEARRAEGWQVAHARPERTGFPLGAALKLDGLALRAPNGVGWQSERATLGLFAQDHRQLRLELTGAQQLIHPRGAMPVQSRFLTVRLRLDGQGGTLEGEGLRLGEGLELRRLAVNIFGTDFDLRGEGIVASGVSPGLSRVDSLQLSGRLTHPPGSSAAAWRAAGGTLNIGHGELRMGDVAAQLRATITLDAQLQPEGRGNLTIIGVQEGVNALVAAGLLAPNMAGGLRTVLSLAARVPAEGGPARVELPLELRNRRVTLARIPLGIFPPLDWR
ncbi:DUF2125 domain-containing protein [Sediminicoccus sp. KRV36]|uniref:DUF2125 domain-containing protein n=1 Tax=Sediminicoccus sp. KRV36 TaxID=3133721 RepID=UPI00200D9A5E|nr:DUF2125 domain-containing protein [Sediminicoccus rosea]UPY37951.1 DUF2125 domain-containing protein [Sediminicoccus rosea]